MARASIYGQESNPTTLANPPFDESDWFRKDDDVRWQFGLPPQHNATSPGCSTATSLAKMPFTRRDT